MRPVSSSCRPIYIHTPMHILITTYSVNPTRLQIACWASNRSMLMVPGMSAGISSWNPVENSGCGEVQLVKLQCQGGIAEADSPEIDSCDICACYIPRD